MLNPDKMNLKQSYSTLCEVRKGNVLSKMIFRKWCDANAFPYEDEPECQSIKTYKDFVRLHTKIWYLD